MKERIFLVILFLVVNTYFLRYSDLVKQCVLFIYVTSLFMHYDYEEIMNESLSGPSYINVKNESQIIHNSTKMLNLEDNFAYSNTEDL